jgi:selenocysteine-specific elongation factor
MYRLFVRSSAAVVRRGQTSTLAAPGPPYNRRPVGRLVERRSCSAPPEHREQFNDAEQRFLHDVESLFKDHPFDPPGPTEIADRVRITAAQFQRVLRILMEQQRLVRIGQDRHFHAEAVAVAREKLVACIKANEGLESVKFKYLLDMSRKYAIPLLAYFDKIGLARRAGYARSLRRAPAAWKESKNPY